MTPLPNPNSGSSHPLRPPDRTRGPRDYCLISPCRNEARFLRRTLESVTGQSEPPALWVIVDDSSTDGTAEILEEYARRFPYIQVVQRRHTATRRVGPGVVEAFYDGYRRVRDLGFDYICKLDTDLELPPRYFATLLDLMQADPRLGTVSGKPFFPADTNPDADPAGDLISEKIGDEMSAGMIKFYRHACFREIGGFVGQVMWDGIDCHRCRMHGWIAGSDSRPELRFLHLRPMGSSEQSLWTGRKRHGYGQWFMGTGLIYLLVSVIYRGTRPPRITGGLGILWGYLQAMIQARPRYEDRVFRAFLHRYQRACLLHGKPAATRRTNLAQLPIWIRRHGEPGTRHPRQAADHAAAKPTPPLETPALQLPSEPLPEVSS